MHRVSRDHRLWLGKPRLFWVWVGLLLSLVIGCTSDARDTVQVTGLVDDGSATSPIGNAMCRFVGLDNTELTTFTADANGVYRFEVQPDTQGFVECSPSSVPNLVLRTFISTTGMEAGTVLTGQDILPNSTVISELLRDTLSNNPNADLAALLGNLRNDLANSQSNLALLADAATVLFNAILDAGLNVDFSLALDDLFSDGQVNLTDLQTIAAAVEQAVTTAEQGRGLVIETAFAARFPGFTVSILHNNDGESQLINAGAGLEDFGGMARFATVVQQLRAEAAIAGRSSVLLSSGDNFLAGPEFNASLTQGVPFFDTIGLQLIGYDAIALGNHEFDFGPDVLADFIGGFTTPVPFLSTNLDVSGEPRLQALAGTGRIAGSTILTRNGQRLGVIGATTPRLPFISSPRHVAVDDDVAGAIQAEVDRLTAQGINKIILVSHLQSINEDLALAPQLRNVDIMIAGGGDELLANDGALLIPGDETTVFGSYPLIATDAEGRAVPVITTSGDYRYVGRLIVEFDAAGRVISIDPASGPVRVAGGANADAVTPEAQVQAQVVDPVQTAVDALAANLIATSAVDLNGLRSAIRTQETNQGNLIADALLFQASVLTTTFNTPPPDVALQNGGGIRNNNTIPAGDLSELDTFSILPFTNFVAIVPDIPAAQFKEILENAVSRVAFTDGRFAQIAGFRLVWEPNGTAQVLDGNGNVTTPGTRVLSVVLDDGTLIVQDGVVVPGAPAVHIATIDFLANGGDQYPFRGAPFTTLGVTYQQALANYIEQALGGVITAAEYPEGGAGRITTLRVSTESTPDVLGIVNGVTVLNGGFGSDMAQVPNTPGAFYLLTDRGPNVAGPGPNTLIFPFPNFTPQIRRFQVNGTALQRDGVILLRDALGTPLSGLPNPPGGGGTGETPLDANGNVLPFDANGIDPEGLVALTDGTFWLSDEYGPHILHVDATGVTLERINPFGTGTGGRALPRVFATRRANRGMEGLTITPDNSTLVGIMQSSLDNPSNAVRRTSRITRIVTFHIATGVTQQFVYLQELPGLSNSAIVARSATSFLVLERDGDFPGDPNNPSDIKRIYHIDLTGATDVSDPADGAHGRLFGGQTLEQLCLNTPCDTALAVNGIVPVSKSLVVDLLTLGRLYPHDKPEGFVVIDNTTLAVVNDDDFGVVDMNGALSEKLLPATGSVDQNELWFIQIPPLP